MVLQWWFDQAIQRTRTPGTGGRVEGAPHLWYLTVTRDEWCQAAAQFAAEQGRLISMWAGQQTDGTPILRAAFAATQGVLVLCLPVSASDTYYPGIEQLFPCANRMERAIKDLSGLSSTDPDTRSWLRHAAWPDNYHPLNEITPLYCAQDTDHYAFVTVEGEGVHEIPVGPVHAGIIEPGHFRFSIVGEKVLRLEERLGYVHKGIEKRFTEIPILEGHRLAARVSGDTAVAYSWAYCQALEGMTATRVPSRALWLRALALELERIANHLGDLGALGNDAGFAFGLAQFSRLKELLLRATNQALGQRYLLDFIVPGGTHRDLSSTGIQVLRGTLDSIMSETDLLRTIYDEHAGVRDRFSGAGVVTSALAAQLGLCGLAGRASGQALDLRCDLPCDPYDDLKPKKQVRSEGDVAARVALRFDEISESIRLVKLILQQLPTGSYQVAVSMPNDEAWGIGLIEGWRGPVLIAIDAGPEGKIMRCHPHDPSWQNWPVIEHAVINNIVPDFPLINKSFNLSYSGHDL